MTPRSTDHPHLRRAVARLTAAATSADPQLGAFFLGPKAENASLFADLVRQAVDSVAFYRRDFHPEDPAALTERLQHDPAYLDSVGRLKARYSELLSYLGAYTTPYFSMRYLGHMLWDTTLPAMLGYLATMFHNPNNVTVQASTVTTFLEIQVGWELCAMVGFPFDRKASPWGHITADGSVANLEAAWSARELTYLPVGIRDALRDPGGRYHRIADRVKVRYRGNKERLVDLDDWAVLNLRMKEALALPRRIGTKSGDRLATVWEELRPYTLNQRGLLDLTGSIDGVGDPVLIAPGSMHYSWPKAMAVLGAGSAGHNLWGVPVDADARLDLAALDDRLGEALELRRPVMLVVAVMGSTEEGAVDPLTGVLELRDRYRARGLDFNIHADAAWGGYFCSAIRRDFSLPKIIDGDDRPTAVGVDDDTTYLSRHVVRQLEAIADADSVTIDPHKMGYAPYPAGALCYRDERITDLVAFGAPVIGSDVTSISIGQRGIEGSKPGAAPAAVWLSHAVLPPSESGHGKLIRHAMYNTKLLYLRMRDLAGDRFRTTMLAHRHPEEPDVAETAALFAPSTPVRDRVDSVSRGRLREVGPDMNMVDFVFNFRQADGAWNTDLNAFNDFNVAVYGRFHVHEGTAGPDGSFEFGQRGDDLPLIITQTELDTVTYGRPLLDDLAKRVGLDVPEGDYRLKVNRSVIMDPWDLEMAVPGGGDFLDLLMGIYRSEVDEVATVAAEHIPAGSG